MESEKHDYTLDKYNRGVCKFCGKVKQWPYEKIELSELEIKKINRGYFASGDAGSPPRHTCHLERFRIEPVVESLY